MITPSTKEIREVVMNVYRTCIVSLALGLLPLAASKALAQDYYIVDGKRVELQASPKYEALKVRPGTSDAKIRTLRASVHASGIGVVEDSPLLARHGIVLIEIGEGIGPSAVLDRIAPLMARDEVEMKNPVYRSGSISLVLVNEFAIQFDPKAGEDAIKQSLEGQNARVVRKDEKVRNRYFVTFADRSPRDALAASNRFAEDPLVVFSEPNFVRIHPQRPRVLQQPVGPGPSSAAPPQSPASGPQDPLFGKQWYLSNPGSPGKQGADVEAIPAWDVQKGNGVVVAIIDEGVDTSHEDLKSKIVRPFDAVDGDNEQEPNGWDGHGTACAGIAASVTDNPHGVAGIGWDVSIMPVRIAYSNHPGGSWFTSNSIIESGIRTATDRGANVLSNSWGGGGPSNLINSAIDYAIANDRVVVFAAGNESGPVSYPANLSTSRTVIAVSATNEWDEFKTKTSRDGEDWWGSNFGPEVSVSAPGVHMYTTDISGTDGYANGNYTAAFNGTSSATPLVAGTAALLLAANPKWKPDQIQDHLQATADDLGPSGFDNQFGWGRLNACKALDGLCSSSGGGAFGWAGLAVALALFAITLKAHRQPGV
jgi:subtilisin family serine protease